MEVSVQMASMVRIGRKVLKLGCFQKTYAALRILTHHFENLNSVKSPDVEIIREAILLEITVYLSLLFLMVIMVI